MDIFKLSRVDNIIGKTAYHCDDPSRVGKIVDITGLDNEAVVLEIKSPNVGYDYVIRVDKDKLVIVKGGKA